MRIEEDGGISPAVALSAAARAPASKHDRLIARAQAFPPATTLVVHPCDETSLRGTVDAAAARIIVPILVGPARKIAATAEQFGLDISRFDLVDAPHSDAAAAKAVELVREAEGELLMKMLYHECGLKGLSGFSNDARELEASSDPRAAMH